MVSKRVYLKVTAHYFGLSIKLCINAAELALCLHQKTPQGLRKAPMTFKSNFASLAYFTLACH